MLLNKSEDEEMEEKEMNEAELADLFAGEIVEFGRRFSLLDPFSSF